MAAYEQYKIKQLIDSLHTYESRLNFQDIETTMLKHAIDYLKKFNSELQESTQYKEEYEKEFV